MQDAHQYQIGRRHRPKICGRPRVCCVSCSSRRIAPWAAEEALKCKVSVVNLCAQACRISHVQGAQREKRKEIAGDNTTGSEARRKGARIAKPQEQLAYREPAAPAAATNVYSTSYSAYNHHYYEGIYMSPSAGDESSGEYEAIVPWVGSESRTLV